MKLVIVSVVLLVVGGCLSNTPLGAQREAQRAYDECVALNGEARCGKEKALAEKRRRELDDRDLNQGETRDTTRY